MDISSSLAAGAYGRAVATADPAEAGESSIATSVEAFARDFSETVRRAETAAQDTMLGRADTQSMVEAMAQAQLAVETAVTLRDKVVEAYQEIMRMQI
ncbi:flagellar hook-basal body complex protein FliE [Mangrovicoccus algicola]|uniref:Flagellar hook-basal body complex protein FliE n=1 Tax=Mangrovicoccus algicola TaxID=2771008 RepID=A0A8J6YZ14_9RHOB|nr:flagellar hook-basal body complex protein FliE [Mangrovicoccus algicola]MBE3640225.1 flagellar hook-basal body complex protein FliE [Mangrovicoccus algicola]